MFPSGGTWNILGKNQAYDWRLSYKKQTCIIEIQDKINITWQYDLHWPINDFLWLAHDLHVAEVTCNTIS